MTEEKQQKQKTVKSEKITKQLLGPFYIDKKYLEWLLKDEGAMFFISIPLVLLPLLCLYMFYSL